VPRETEGVADVSGENGFVFDDKDAGHGASVEGLGDCLNTALSSTFKASSTGGAFRNDGIAFSGRGLDGASRGRVLDRDTRLDCDEGGLRWWLIAMMEAGASW
jgi:hypothetical protein